MRKIKNKKSEIFKIEIWMMLIMVVISTFLGYQEYRYQKLLKSNIRLSEEFEVVCNEKFLACDERDRLLGLVDEYIERIDELEGDVERLEGEMEKKSTTNITNSTSTNKTYQTDSYGKYYTVTLKVTAYCPCVKCCGKYALNRKTDSNGEPIVYTSSGARAKNGYTIAMGKAYAFGTKVYIPGRGICEVQDRGGAVTNSVVDLYFSTHEQALSWGNRTLQVKIYV